jgi:hypothetical protein
MLIRGAAVIALMAWHALGQQQASDPPDNAVPQPEKHIFFIVPNFRTSMLPVPYTPVSAREKFHIASQDAFDRGTVGLAVLFGGESFLTNANPSFGHGVKGFVQYAGASYADYAIGDFMTEAIFPTILHQDPRYFRRGTGSFLSRLGYTIGQSVITHDDSGRMDFNYSEILGNSASVAISQLYYKDNRTAHDAAKSLAVQLAVDASSNVLKEFWPDVSRKFRRKKP